MLTPCWTSENGSDSESVGAAVPIHRNLNKSVLGVQFAKRPNYVKTPLLNQVTSSETRAGKLAEEREGEDYDSSTVLVVSSETNVFVYKTTEVDCIKSWILESDNSDNPSLKLNTKAVLVPGTSSVVCPIDEGSRLLHLDYESPSGAVQVKSKNVSMVKEPVSRQLVHSDLEGVVVLVSDNGAVALHTVADGYNSTSKAVMAPTSLNENSKDESISVSVKDAKLVAVSYSKIPTKKNSNKKRIKVAVEWQVVLTEELITSSTDADQPDSSSLRIRTVDIKPKSAMLALTLGPVHMVDIPESCQPNTEELKDENQKSKGYLEIVSACLLTNTSISLVWKNGLCQRVALTPRKPNAYVVSCRSMMPPASLKSGTKRNRTQMSAKPEDFTVASATPIFHSKDSGKEALICYGVYDKSVALWDSKFAVPLDQSEIYDGKPVASDDDSVVIIEQCPTTLNTASSQKVALATASGTVFLYQLRLVKSSLAGALGKLSSTSTENYKMETLKASDSKILLKDDKIIKRRWLKAFEDNEQLEMRALKKLRKDISKLDMLESVTALMRANRMTLPYNFAQSIVGYCLENESRGLWDLLRLAIKSRAVSSCANDNLIPTLIRCNQVGLLFDALACVEDLTEKNIADILLYILNEPPARALKSLGKSLKKGASHIGKKNRDGTFEKIAFPKNYTLEQLGVHSVLLGALCVPNNKVFMVQMLNKMKEGDIEALFSVLAYTFTTYQEAPDKDFRKHVYRASRPEKDGHLLGRVPVYPNYKECLRWLMTLLDARFQPIISRAVSSQRFSKLLYLVRNSCSDHINLCETMETLQEPLGQYLKKRKTAVPHKFPSDYSVEYVAL